jgi:hypothetical protein
MMMFKIIASELHENRKKINPKLFILKMLAGICGNLLRAVYEIKTEIHIINLNMYKNI